VYPERAPVAYGELKALWLGHLALAPADVQLVRGAAAFIAAESTDESKMLIRSALARHPDAAELWFDLGRISLDPGERLAAFETARDTGAQNSNLLVWIAETAFKAGEFAKAERTAQELMALVHDARSIYGDKLDWPELGGELWRRARTDSESSADASIITDAIAQHAYRKHWAHTVLGLLACRNNDIDHALFHLRESADVRPDYRLSSYGPSADLLEQVCVHGRWEDALDYLRAWENTWDDPRLKNWMASVKEHRVPEFADKNAGQ
jgi:tetratricopeptide (TPR) repeat protein